MRADLIKKAMVKRIINEGSAEVALLRDMACGGECSSCTGCARMGVTTVTAENPVGAEVRDIVTITGRLPGGTAAAVLMSFVYFIPVVAFLAFYGIGMLLSLPDEQSVILSLAGLAAGWFAAWRIRRNRETSKVSYEITNIES